MKSRVVICYRVVVQHGSKNKWTAVALFVSGKGKIDVLLSEGGTSRVFTYNFFIVEILYTSLKWRTFLNQTAEEHKRKYFAANLHNVLRPFN